MADNPTIDLPNSFVEADARYYEGRAEGWETGYEAGLTQASDLAAKSRALVALLDDAERNQGGLLSVDILKAGNELRLELARWAK